jgi:hypothetical protein
MAGNDDLGEVRKDSSVSDDNLGENLIGPEVEVIDPEDYLERQRIALAESKTPEDLASEAADREYFALAQNKTIEEARKREELTHESALVREEVPVPVEKSPFDNFVSDVVDLSKQEVRLPLSGLVRLAIIGAPRGVEKYFSRTYDVATYTFSEDLVHERTSARLALREGVENISDVLFPFGLNVVPNSRKENVWEFKIYAEGQEIESPNAGGKARKKGKGLPDLDLPYIGDCNATEKAELFLQACEDYNIQASLVTGDSAVSRKRKVIRHFYPTGRHQGKDHWQMKEGEFNHYFALLRDKCIRRVNVSHRR